MENSSFNKIPVEIRKVIYGFALTQDDPIKLAFAENSNNQVGMYATGTQLLSPTYNALSLACKQMCSEVAPMIMEVNTFRFELAQFPNGYGDDSYEGAVSSVMGFFMSKGDDSKLVKGVHFSTGMWQVDAADYEEMGNVRGAIEQIASILHAKVEVGVEMRFEQVDFLAVAGLGDVLSTSVAFALGPRGAGEMAARAAVDKMVREFVGGPAAVQTILAFGDAVVRDVNFFVQ